jgi:hypothetical protein
MFCSLLNGVCLFIRECFLLYMRGATLLEVGCVVEESNTFEDNPQDTFEQCKWHNNSYRHFRRPWLFSAAYTRPPKISPYFWRHYETAENSVIFGGQGSGRENSLIFGGD